MKKPLEVLRLYPEHDYTLNGTLASRAGTDPQRPFIFYRDRTWTWGEFAQTVDAAARVLASCGIGKGDRMGVIARTLLRAHGGCIDRGCPGAHHPPEPITASTSISMRMRGSARPACSIVAAGRTSPKAARRAGHVAGKSAASGRM